MLRLSRKMLFALEAVVDIAFNARPEPVQSKEITKRQGIRLPPPAAAALGGHPATMIPHHARRTRWP